MHYLLLLVFHTCGNRGSEQLGDFLKLESRSPNLDLYTVKLLICIMNPGKAQLKKKLPEQEQVMQRFLKTYCDFFHMTGSGGRGVESNHFRELCWEVYPLSSGKLGKGCPQKDVGPW